LSNLFLAGPDPWVWDGLALVALAATQSMSVKSSGAILADTWFLKIHQYTPLPDASNVGGIMLHSSITPNIEELPDPVKELLSLMKQHYGQDTDPMAFATFGRPANPNGFWWVDFNTKPGRVTVQWNDEKGFGISLYELPELKNTENVGYGEGPDHVARSPKEAFEIIQRIISENLDGPIESNRG
jgi:hypothetical protein